MTEKRFIMSGYSIWDSQNDNRRVSTETAYKLLNELDTENRKLKNELNLSKLNLKEKNEGFDKLHKMYMEQIEENKELKYKNEILYDELEQCKAVIDKKWSEYLKKKME